MLDGVILIIITLLNDLLTHYGSLPYLKSVFLKTVLFRQKCEKLEKDNKVLTYLKRHLLTAAPSPHKLLSITSKC